MPRYYAEVIVPAGTTRSDPVEESLRLDQAFVQDAIVYIDSGAKNRVKVELLDGDRRLFPFRDSDPFSTPAVTDPAPIQRQLPGRRRDVTIRATAPDAVNDHAVLVSVDAISVEAARAQGLAPGQFTRGGLQVEDSEPAPEDLQDTNDDS